MQNFGFNPNAPRYSMINSTFLPSSLNPRVTVNNLAINKWNLKFDGESGLSSFLERVDELRVARGVSEDQLFTAAVELFSGNALVWYRSVRDKVSSWDQLVSALRAAFLPADYEAALWEEIRNRSQGPYETVTVYIAVMENLFRRLPHVPCESTRLTFIRRNLQPYLHSQLALATVSSIAELTRVCKILEDARSHAAKFKNPPTNLHGLVEPDLAYHRPRHSSSLAVVDDHVPEVAAVAPVVNPVAKTTCWNCGQPNHRSISCPMPRKRHCFRCGRPDVTVRTCPSCSGNGVPRR